MGSRHSSPYLRLPPSPETEIRQPLLINNYGLEDIEQMKFEIGKKYEALVKKNKELDREIGDLRCAMSRLESRPHPPPPVGVTSSLGTDATLKNAFDKLVLRVKDLELGSIMKLKTINMEKLAIKSTELENKIMNLTTNINQLKAELLNLMFQKEQEMDKLVKKNDALENTIMELSTIETMPVTDSTRLVPEHQNPFLEMNDLISCLVVIIFLLAILIGINI